MNLTQAFQNWRRYRNTLNELQRMSNRELDDLGIGRSSMRQIARRAV